MRKFATIILSVLWLSPAVPALAQNIFTLGDSNGEARDGWVAQLKTLLPGATIFNQSLSGNTIGFDNLGQERLNTLKNVDKYVQAAIEAAQGRPYDYLVVCLGTNDCKAEYADRQEEVKDNFSRLLQTLRQHPVWEGKCPKLVIVTPPPYGEDSIMLEKYKGGDARVKALVPVMKKAARKNKALFVDVYTPLKPLYAGLSPDGIHMKAEGQQIIARQIIAKLKLR
jgi:lysophospholipase L1-like esterase